MQEGLHLAHNRNNTDFYAGSGMRNGASGGPWIANIGYLGDSASFKGLWPYRNVVFAVYSWLYNSESYKIVGASSLSGYNNSNNFTGMFNAACAWARNLHGTATCSPL